MDASDAAEYVQDLAGEDANIIFGAMYDDSKADEATITVIATGLHNVGGTASKLKSRLESQRPAAMWGIRLHIQDMLLHMTDSRFASRQLQSLI